MSRKSGSSASKAEIKGFGVADAFMVCGPENSTAQLDPHGSRSTSLHRQNGDSSQTVFSRVMIGMWLDRAVCRDLSPHGRTSPGRRRIVVHTVRAGVVR